MFVFICPYNIKCLIKMVDVTYSRCFCISMVCIIHAGKTIFGCLLSCSSFDKSVEEWRQFHCDLNDLSQWLAEAEGLLAEAQTPEVSMDIEMARIHQQVCRNQTYISLFCISWCWLNYWANTGFKKIILLIIIFLFNR